MKRTIFCLGIAAAAWLASGSDAAAQFPAARTINKPTFIRRPTVSPYLNLIQYEQASNESLPVYQNLVRPFVDQRRVNQAQANQVFQLQQQVARNAERTSRGESLRETGHVTLYQNHSHFFPSMGQVRR